MSRKFIHITSDKKYNVVDLPRENFNDFVHKVLDCSIFETAPLFDNYVFILDESGKLKEKHTNFIATVMYPGFPADIIVGDALVGKVEFVEEYGEHDLCGLEDEEIEFFLNLCKATDSLEYLLDRNMRRSSNSDKKENVTNGSE